MIDCVVDAAAATAVIDAFLSVDAVVVAVVDAFLVVDIRC